jgi:hypothetical protein
MDYHLCRHGQNVGIFPLEELRRRRAIGELSGDDLVWREGMAAWASLDSVVGTSNPGTPGGTRPPPIPAAALKPKSNRPLIWGITAGVVLAVVAIIAMGFVAVRVARTIRQMVQLAGNGNSAAATEAAGRRIRVSTNAITATVVRKRSREFRIRQYVEAYQKVGRHTAAWDGEASQLMESWIAARFGGPTNLPSPETLSDKLAAMPECDDPIVLTITAANAIEEYERLRRLERAVAGFKQSRYRAYPKFYATVVLASLMESRSPRVRSLDQEAMQHLKEAFADGSIQPEDEEELAEILVNGWAEGFFQRHGAAVCQIVGQTKCSLWLKLALEGEQEINEAWKARGSNSAESVTSQGWQGFAIHLAKARSALTRAWKLQPRRPLAPTRMIRVAMGQTGAEEMRTWFDRAVEAQIDYPQAWSQMRWGLRPRWQGSHEAMLALGIQAVETRRFDTDVPRMFFDFISDVESEMDLQPGEHIYGRPDIWPHLKQIYEGYLAEPSEKQRQAGWHTTYAAVAYLAGDFETAKTQLEANGWKSMRENLTGWGTDLSLMPLKVAALTGESSRQINSAEASYSQGDLAAPVKLYTELSSSPGTDERTREFSRCRLAALKQEQLLAKGEWIDLMPADEKDPNWAFTDNKVRRLPDGALEVESGPRGHRFYCRTRVGPQFEVTGEFELVRSSSGDFQAGLVMGLPDSLNSDWYSFRMKRNSGDGQVASFSHGWTSRQVASRATLNDNRNSFRFTLEDGKADAWVNGIQVLQQAAPGNEANLRDDCLLGLGAYNDTDETVIRYRNIKVRRLHTAPKPAES